MKKATVLVFVLALVFSGLVLADMGGKGNEGGMMWGKADVKVENTADGVKIMVTSKDAKEIKVIQEHSAKMAEMREKMASGKVGGKVGGMGGGMEGMEMMGHGMWNQNMDGQIHKKMMTCFVFLIIIWLLLIILMSVTIILICKKIMAK